MLWTLWLIFLWLIGGAHISREDAAHCNTQNLQLNGTTSQSSDYTYGGVVYSSGRAIDGDKEKCAHTLNQPNSWWMIDLLDIYNISCISIYNTDETNTDIKNAQIYIGNSREKNGTTNRMCTNITDFTKAKWNNFPFNSDVSGRYISVFSQQNNFLILCEVKIYGTKKESPFVLVKENKTWEEALYYCRDKYADLASIVDSDTQTWAELEAKKANTPFVWLGLRYTCTLEFWFWVADQQVKFNQWAPGNETKECDRSGAMETREEHLWFSKSDYETFYFICAK